MRKSIASVLLLVNVLWERFLNWNQDTGYVYVVAITYAMAGLIAGYATAIGLL